MSDYFSDRENGPVARTEQVISPIVWAGLAALIQALVNSGAFAFRFPERCPDGQVVCGVDEGALAANVQAEMPGLAWPLQTAKEDADAIYSLPVPYAPATLLILDFLEYVHASIAKPLIREHHSYFRHDHLAFDQDAGQTEFRGNVNRVFARNGIAYELHANGRVVRLLPAVLGEALARTLFRTGDTILDNALNECRAKFSSPNPLIRREALERLWDAWERLKSLADLDKKKSIALLLDRASSEASFRALLEAEARALNEIGNSRLIRHYEVSQVPVIDSDHVDYLFHRLFAMMQLLLGRVS
ncbi:hypothetical protein YO5_18062 [Stutzerimonas stutzeri TS44]|nr:hypothetical protein YO5_18062 [Stutzerimonas stutzeri TS44]